ncbi:MAG TPA: family 43 glycosylhydrolase [Acidimicrobiales bacterium]|jgi:beta-xylosidase|nr:family 43 glycosylhydrolase [Acidimicrobiales bacterium]
MRRAAVASIVAVLLGACASGAGTPRESLSMTARVADSTTVPETTGSTQAPPAPEPTSAPAPEPVAPETAAARTDIVRPRAASRRPATTAPVVKRPPPRPNRATDGAAAPAPPPPSSRAVFDGDFPDPFVLRAGAYWYAFSTQSGITHVPVLRSADLRTWERAGDALPGLPSWSSFGYVWAPAVMARPMGGFVLYYSTRHAATGLQCLSVAVAALPQGPYVDTSTGPFVCQTDRGGSIDPSPFTAADGAPWLAWKSEGTLDGEPTRIWTAPLTAEGTALAGEPREVLSTAEVWEGPIVEAPTMVVEGGRYHLFFSGNRWETAQYAIGHAVCDGPAGPCRRVPAEPIVASDATRAGPGGGEVFRDASGALLLAHHAWAPAAVGYPAGARRLHIDTLTFDGERAAAHPWQGGSVL